MMLVKPGNILKGYMAYYTLTQEGLAHAIGYSQAQVSRVINGVSRITERFASQLEILWPDTVKELWLDLQTEYDANLKRKNILKSSETRLKQLGYEFYGVEDLYGLVYQKQLVFIMINESEKTVGKVKWDPDIGYFPIGFTEEELTVALAIIKEVKND